MTAIMAANSDNYIQTAKEYEQLVHSRNESKAWKAYKAAAEKLISLIRMNQRTCKYHLLPLLEVPYESTQEMKLRRLQIKQDSVKDEYDFIRCPRIRVAIKDAPANDLVIKTWATAIGAPDRSSGKTKYQSFNEYQARTEQIGPNRFRLDVDIENDIWKPLCELKIIGEGNARMAIFADGDNQELEAQAKQTYALYQAMDQDEVCKKYEDVKFRFKLIAREFFLTHQATIIVANASNAKRKIEKWVAGL